MLTEVSQRHRLSREIPGTQEQAVMICSHPKGLAGARAEELVTSGGMNAEALRVIHLPPFFHPTPACPHLLTLEDSNNSSIRCHEYVPSTA